MELSHTAENGHAIPALLAMPDDVIAQGADRLLWKLFLWRLQRIRPASTAL